MEHIAIKLMQIQVEKQIVSNLRLLMLIMIKQKLQLILQLVQQQDQQQLQKLQLMKKDYLIVQIIVK